MSPSFYIVLSIWWNLQMRMRISCHICRVLCVMSKCVHDSIRVNARTRFFFFLSLSSLLCCSNRVWTKRYHIIEIMMTKMIIAWTGTVGFVKCLSLIAENVCVCVCSSVNTVFAWLWMCVCVHWTWKLWNNTFFFCCYNGEKCHNITILFIRMT